MTTELDLRAPEDDSEQAEHGRPPAWGWAINLPPGSIYRQIVPTWDTGPHYTEDCPCGAELDEGGDMMHNSYDGRERYMRKLALPH